MIKQKRPTRLDYDRYYALLKKELEAANHAPFYRYRGNDKNKDNHRQISFYLGVENVHCYHNFMRDPGSAPLCMWVGMAAHGAAIAPFKKQFSKSFGDKEATKKKLGFSLETRTKRDFWAPGILAPSDPQDLESLIPKSVERLEKFREFVIPVMMKAFSS